MNRRAYLRVKTREPAFLWRMVLGIVLAGVVLGLVAERISQTVGHDERRVVASKQQSWQNLQQQARDGQWWDVWWGMPELIYSDFSRPGLVVLVVLSGGCWLVFLLQALRVGGFTDWRLATALVAIGLGILSIWPTGFFILWQEVGWGLVESPQLVPGLRYYVFGVALREEFAKLLCLLPLMPLLLRQRDEFAALILSACVGLGFAIEENLGYFLRTHGQATMGRFLTANPAHFAFTGLIGLAVYRGLRDPKNWGPQAVAVFLTMVLAHGIYNAAIALPALADYALASTIVFALVMFQFFRELRSLRPRGGDTISLTATFLCGVSLLTAFTFVYLSWIAGSQVAFDTMMTDLIAFAVMIYLFLREMPDSMINV